MTTTLRPVGPERHGPGGARARDYAVCVNGRAAGEVRLTTDEESGGEAGRIEALRIGEGDRRRGRAAVAALAAEEVLRGWGCLRAEVSIPPSAGAALRLATSLGYTERDRGMVKSLSGPPPVLPGGSTVRAMGEDEYPLWIARQERGYVAEWVARGVSEDQARAKAEAGRRETLPEGPATPGTALRVLSHGGRDVGTIWVSVREAAGHVFSVEVGAEYRGQGHGRALMAVAERECGSAGLRTITLNVFAGNIPALRLYESLGYESTCQHFCKPLG